jgi:hypothetical protein
MINDFEYYYNDVPNKGLCRNNLIYTSLISKDRKTFCQWYFNDTDYHKGQNEVIDSSLMEEKWTREVTFLLEMADNYPHLVPNILDINYRERKIFLEIDGYDFWQQAGPAVQDYDSVLPNWREQMIDIFRAHKQLGIYKYSLHPSSYFVVNDQLKSINYFFCYKDTDSLISLRSVLSHISEDRRKDLFPKMAALGIDIDTPTPFKSIQHLAFDSFKTNFPSEVMEEAKLIYV